MTDPLNVAIFDLHYEDTPLGFLFLELTPAVASMLTALYRTARSLGGGDFPEHRWMEVVLPAPDEGVSIRYSGDTLRSEVGDEEVPAGWDDQNGPGCGLVDLSKPESDVLHSVWHAADTPRGVVELRASISGLSVMFGDFDGYGVSAVLAWDALLQAGVVK